MLDLHAVILEDLEHIVSQPVSWDKLQGKTVLVTGASGMIASYLVFTLLYLNDTRHLNIRVLALVRNGEKAKQQFGNILVRHYVADTGRIPSTGLFGPCRLYRACRQSGKSPFFHYRSRWYYSSKYHGY